MGESARWLKEAGSDEQAELGRGLSTEQDEIIPVYNSLMQEQVLLKSFMALVYSIPVVCVTISGS